MNTMSLESADSSRASLSTLITPLLIIIAYVLLPCFYFRPLWVNLFILTFLSYRFWLHRTASAMPNKYLLLSVQLGVGIATWSHFHEFFGGDAGGTLLGLLLVLKTFELKRSRDFFVSTMRCLLVIMSHALEEQGLSLTLFSLLGVLLVVTYLQALEAGVWSWKIWRSTLKYNFKFTLQAVPILVLLFLLFPRFQTGFGSNATVETKTGVSDSLTPGSVANLIPSDELIFRATFLNGDTIPVSQMYWRGAVLDISDGMNWARLPGESVRQMINGSDSGDVEVYLEPGSDRMLFSLDSTERVGFVGDSSGRRVHEREGRIFELSSALQLRERYYLDLATERKPEPRPQAKWLQISAKPSKRMQEWLKPLVGKSTTQIVSELLMFFRRAGFEYTLQPPPTQGMEDFLFRTKSGFCEHYAGTMATLLRHLGVPARVVVGFQGGSQSLLGNYVTVRGHDAHAWVEYFDDTISRWRRVDPTAQVSITRMNRGNEGITEVQRAFLPSWAQGSWLNSYLKLRAVVDQVDATWTSFLLGFDLSWQRSILAKLGMDEVLFRALPVFLVLSVAFMIALLYFFQAQRREPLAKEERLYRQLIHLLEKKGIVKTAFEGPLTLRNKLALQRPDLLSTVDSALGPLTAIRYGGEPVKADALAQVRQALRDLRRQR
jgi:transglutaminase-like putative cysteine protease